MRIKHSTTKSFITLLISSILTLSSVMVMSVSATVTPAVADPKTLSVTYSFDESEIRNWLSTKEFMKNLRTQSNPGEPLTPYKVAKILLPPHTEVAHVSIVGKVGGQCIIDDIPCGQPPVIIGEKPTTVEKNPAIYNSDELYPKEIHGVGSVESFRGYNILHVRLYPVQYMAASKLALYYKEMMVQVNLREGSAADHIRNLLKDRETAENLVDNPSILATYDSTLASLDAFDTIYEYLIVTTAPLADEFQVLVDWKAHFLAGATVHTVDAAATDQEVKDIINHYYTCHGTSYVLLGGDVGVLPYHTKQCIVGYHVVNIAEDYWFANLIGDDDISYYEVYIGRAPVDNSAETTNFVNKVIAYEQMPKPKANLFHESRSDHGNVPNATEVPAQCEQYVPQDYINYELFEENGRIEKTDWINFWRNDGIMCEHTGHGGEDGYYINYEVGGGSVAWYNTDVASMDNTFWPVHTSDTCLAGAFEYEDCLAEAYVKDPDNGAIACLFNDKEGWYSSDDATMFSGDFIEMQFKGLYQEGYQNIGTMLAYSKHCFISEATNTSDPDQPVWEWCWREINLIGDPETPLLTTRVDPSMNVIKNGGWETGDNSFWNVSTIKAPNSVVYYEVNQDSSCFGTHGFHVSMETSSSKPLYTTQSLMEYQYLSKAMLDTNTKLRYMIYPAYELHGVNEIPKARWEIILFFSTENKLHYYGSLNMAPTDNSTDKYVSMPIDLSQWNEFHDNYLLQTYASKFGTPPVGTTITKIAAYVISETYAAKRNQFNRVVANFDSDEDAGGLRCTPWYVKNLDTDLNYETIQEAINAPETLAGHTLYISGKYHEHVVVNKSLSLQGVNPDIAIIDGSGTGNVVTVQANKSIISRLRIQNGDFGVYVWTSNNTSVIDNTISNNFEGIFLANSNGNIVRGNTISGNDVFAGITMESSSNNTLSYNEIHNGGYGIHQRFLSNDNNIISNVISNVTKMGIWVEGFIDNHSSGNNICSNTVSNVKYLGGPPGGYGICLYWFSGNSIIDNILSDNDVGMVLSESTNNTITGNTVSSTISQAVAFDFTLTSNNLVCHNNFMDMLSVIMRYSSCRDIWDNGYPSGGNYWSDYNGTDLCSGPYQNQTGSDGIGDIPTIIDEYNIDNYPLMHPWGSIKNIDTDLTYLTIQKAIDASETLNGHTIEVKADTYYENVVVSKSLTLMGEDPSTTILDGVSPFNYGTGFLVYANGTTITGFTVRNYAWGVDSESFNCRISGNKFAIWLGSICLRGSSNGVISNNDISGWPSLGGSMGIYLDYSDNNTIVDNTIKNIFNQAIYIRYSNQNTVRNNLITDNEGTGIDVYSSCRNIISGNTITNTGYSGYDGITLYNSFNHCSYNVISGNTISNNGYNGISIYSICTNNVVSSNTISNNGKNGIYISGGSSNTISYNTISSNCDGIAISSSNTSVSNNIVSNNVKNGICVSGSSNTTISGNTISDNNCGVYLDVYNQNNVIYHNSFINNTVQVYVYPGTTNVWDNGYPSGGNYWSNYVDVDQYSGPYQNETDSDGIWDHSYNVTFKNLDNYPLAHPWGIKNVDTNLTYLTIQEAIDAPETLDGHTIEVYVGSYREEVIVRKSLTLKGISPRTTILDGSLRFDDTGFLVYANGTTVTGFTLQSYNYGVDLWGLNANVSGNTFEGCTYEAIYLHSKNNVISSNYVSKTSWGAGGAYGIYLDHSDNNTIIDNTIRYQSYAIYMRYSNQNTVRNNTIDLRNGRGVYLRDCSDNVFSGNTIANYTTTGIETYNNCNGNVISGNTIANRSASGAGYGIKIYYYCNNIIISGNTITNIIGYGIDVWSSCSNCLISNNKVSNNSYDGISFMQSTGSISDNIVSNNGKSKGKNGIYVFGNSNTTINGNTISNNNCGVYVDVASQNKLIYHNNFINNTVQVYVYPGTTNVWDNGYPSGGNYWSNYVDIDQYSGPYQNETGSDGIWDHSYNVGGNNIDRYPLANSWPVHDVAIIDVGVAATEVLCGDSASVVVTVINQGDFPETFNVTAYYDSNIIGMQVVTDLALRESEILIFTWNTTGVNSGVYAIKAVASVVANETDTGDNTKIDGTITVKAWDLLDEPWNQLGSWTTEGKGTSTIATLDWKRCLYNTPNRATYITREEDIGSLPESGYTVETSLYVKSWGSGGTNAFVAFKFYDGMHLVTIEIHSNRVVGPQNQFSLTTQTLRWYTWRFVVDSDADTIYVYRDEIYVGTLTGLTDSTACDGLVYCSWTQNPTSCSGCESYTDYIKIATGLYTPSENPI